MKSWKKAAARLALTGLTPILLGTTPAHAGRHQNADVTLVSFGSMQGELVTCGCHASPKGGLARRSTIIDSLVTANNPFLHLELGDFSKLDDISGDYETRFIWSILRKTGVNAVAPGPRELTMWSTFEALTKEGGIPVIASNLTVKRNGKESHPGQPFHIFKVGDLKVAVMSLLGEPERAAARPPEGVGFAVQDPIATARELVPRLRRKADLVVLMSQMEPGATDQLVREVPGIDVALYGQHAGWEEKARKVAGTVVNQTGMRGQYAGELTLIVDPKDEIVEFGSRNFALDNTIEEDPEVATLVAAAQAKAKEMRETTRQARAREDQTKNPGGIQTAPAATTPTTDRR
jgi:5'-nucleotidase / UDP-sugar diphosphatase